MLTKIRSLLAAAVLILPGVAGAQDFPDKQVTLVVPFAPGGGVDTVGRYLGEALARHWNETVVVENRPGAGSAVGAAHVTQAKPDGYTLLVTSASFAANAATQPSLPYDPEADLQPVAVLTMGDFFVATGPDKGVDTLADLVEQAKTRKIFYGTNGGVGSISHLTGELMNDVLGIEMEPVHYGGASEVMVDLGGGRIDIAFAAYNDVAGGLGKPIAVLSSTHSKLLPDVPTVAESGFADTFVLNSYWVFAPAGTPADVVTRIHDDIATVMNTPEAVAFLESQAAVPGTQSTAEFTEMVHNEIAKWRSVAEASGVTAD
ncbi:Bug family tripartite tricarboxylate transporter substrate binding protein [Paracoccus sp. P2]|uniref:Bug family tripartite tricarboxylate transporter substrate binding protein n=1 Tax=Paracoccus sp. P2 TaxID=3248840 RepID=UPI00391EF2F7